MLPTLRQLAVQVKSEWEPTVYDWANNMMLWLLVDNLYVGI